MPAQLRIATRKSLLALWQAGYVQNKIHRHHADIQVEFIEIVSEGDKTLDIPLSYVGGKGLFLKELELSLLNGEADLAVHSMKDVTVTLPDGLHIPVVCEREDPRDVLVSNQYTSLDDMPENSMIGTCSLRRQCLMRAHYPHLQVKNLRGNVNTRLARLDAGEFDGIILAAAGLKRLQLEKRIAQYLDCSLFLPAAGQGVVGIECRIDDQRTNVMIEPLNHAPTQWRILAERTVNQKLNGGCHVPVGIFSQIDKTYMHLSAFVGKVDGSLMLSSHHQTRIESPQMDAIALGEKVADDLLSKGAADILDEVYQSTH